MPEGCGTNAMNVYEHSVFDCLVFVITCEEHKTVALTKTNELRMFSWFPFMPLQDVFTWSRLSREGLTLILNKKDQQVSNDDADEEEPSPVVLPDHSLTWHNIFRVQVPKPKKCFTRITQFIQLTGDTDKKCCQNIADSRIRWVKIDDMIKQADAASSLWGNEVIVNCQALLNPVDKPDFLSEFTLKDCFPSQPDEVALLKQLGWSMELVQELFGSYVGHLYPAFQMTASSFRLFLLKHSLLACDDPRINSLFHAFAPGSDCLSFGQLLMGIASMDPKAQNDSAVRARIIFQ